MVGAMIQKRFPEEFKIEAVNLVTALGVAVAHAARDLDAAASVLRRWMRELAQGPRGAFAGNGGMKQARTSRKVYRLRTDALSDVFDYIDRFYNPTSRHSTLGYVSPVQFVDALIA